nr:collagen alpha-1(II) chain-like [Gorilla gorilla gorilla]
MTSPLLFPGAPSLGTPPPKNNKPGLGGRVGATSLPGACPHWAVREYKSPRYQQEAASPARSARGLLPARNLTSLSLFAQGLISAFETCSPQENENRRCFLPAFPIRWPGRRRGREARAPLNRRPLLQGAQALPRVSAGHQGPNRFTGCLWPPNELVAGLGPSAVLFPYWLRTSLRFSLRVAISHPGLCPPPSLPFWPRCPWGRNPGERGLEPIGISCLCPRAPRAGQLRSRGAGPPAASQVALSPSQDSRGPRSIQQIPRGRAWGAADGTGGSRPWTDDRGESQADPGRKGAGGGRWSRRPRGPLGLCSLTVGTRVRREGPAPAPPRRSLPTCAPGAPRPRSQPISARASSVPGPRLLPLPRTLPGRCGDPQGTQSGKRGTRPAHSPRSPATPEPRTVPRQLLDS